MGYTIIWAVAAVAMTERSSMLLRYNVTIVNNAKTTRITMAQCYYFCYYLKLVISIR